MSSRRPTEPEGVPVLRYAVGGVLALAAIVLLLLAVRPFIFSFAGVRGDANYTVAATADVDKGPLRLELVLNDRHGLAGEVADGEHARIFVVVARDLSVGYSVVDAWSPTNDCAVTLGPDRLVDCAGDTWTYAGLPINPTGGPSLVRFPASEDNGAVIADFTQPFTPGG